MTITDRGRPVALLTAIPLFRLRRLLAAGRARSSRRSLADLRAPEPGPSLSDELRAMRDAERF